MPHHHHSLYPYRMSAKGSVMPVLGSTSYLLALMANVLPLGALTTWPDLSGLHHDFARGAGSSGLVVASVGGYKEVQFNAIDDWMLGSDFADNLASMGIFAVVGQFQVSANDSILISKMADDWQVAAGWQWDMYDNSPGFNGGSSLNIGEAGEAVYYSGQKIFPGGSITKALFDIQMASHGSIVAAINGDNTGSTQSGGGGLVGSISNTEPVRIGNVGDMSAPFGGSVYSLIIVSPAPSAPDAAALRTFLALQGGVTL